MVKDNPIFLDQREPILLSYTDGEVHEFEGYKLPETLRRPLIQDGSGYIVGFPSGGRSSIVEEDGKAFKYKGSKPAPNNLWGSGEPEGGMSEGHCMNELRMNRLISEKYLEYGLTPAMISSGWIKYSITDANKRDIYCAILEILGDTRLSTMNSRITGLIRKGEKIRSLEFIKKLFAQLNAWMGFSDRVLFECGILPLDISFGLDNYVFYRMDGGYGVSRVDSASAETSHEKQKFQAMANVDSNELNALIFSYISIPTIRRLGLSVKKIMKDLEWSDMSLTIVKRKSDEKLEELEDGTKSLNIWKKDFEWFLYLEKIYQDAFEGNIMPEPIDEALISELYLSKEINGILNCFT